jgi:hypothetical protein
MTHADGKNRESCSRKLPSWSSNGSVRCSVPGRDRIFHFSIVFTDLVFVEYLGLFPEWYQVYVI